VELKNVINIALEIEMDNLFLVNFFYLNRSRILGKFSLFNGYF